MPSFSAAAVESWFDVDRDKDTMAAGQTQSWSADWRER